MRQLFRDAIEAAKRTLGFPYLTPREPRSGATGMFSKAITDYDRLEMFKRNQLAHAIIADVAADALSSSFKCGTASFDKEVQALFINQISLPLLRTLTYTRLHGHCGLLIGFRDTLPFSSKVKANTKIDYLQALPKALVKRIIMDINEKTQTPKIPLAFKGYELNTGEIVDASRIIHLYTFNVDESSLNGLSCIDPIYDVLSIIKSMDWGTGQTLWRHGAGLTTFEAPDGSDQIQLDAIDTVVSDINAKSVITVPPGTHVQTHSAGALNPEGYYRVILNQIAAGSRIPVSILIGSQRGALAASEKDRKEYEELLSSIRQNYIIPTLAKLFGLYQAAGQLPKGDFAIEFEKLTLIELEAAKAKMNEASAEHKLGLARLQRANTNLIKLRTKVEAQLLREQRLASKDVMSDSGRPGILVPHPHGELIWRGLQRAIVKPVQLTSHVGEPLYLIDGDSCYGIVMLEKGKEIDLAEFEKLTPRHLVSDDERLQLWKGKRKLFYHPVRLLTLFSRPRKCTVPDDAQNFVMRVEFT